MFLNSSVKPVLSGHSKIDKKPPILMTNDSLMKYYRMLPFCNAFDLHQVIIGLENQVLIFLSGPLRLFLLYFFIFGRKMQLIVFSCVP